MSLLEHTFPDDAAKKPRAASSPRLRSFKGFPAEAIAALQDPLLTDDPTFWMLGGTRPALAANNGMIGVQTPADPNLVVVVDGAIVGAGAADAISFEVVEGGTAILAVVTDTNVFKRNRREPSVTTQLERVGLLRIFDTNVLAGTQIAAVNVAAQASIVVPLGWRMFAGEQLFARASNANEQFACMMWGRMEAKRR